MKNNYNFIFELIALLCGAIASLCIFIGIFLPFVFLGYQVFLYLHDGYWTSISIIDALKYYDYEWAQSPSNWYGLWNILDFCNVSIPISIGLIFAGFGLLEAISEIRSHEERGDDTILNLNEIYNPNRLAELAIKEKNILTENQLSENEEKNETQSNEIDFLKTDISKSLRYLRDKYSNKIDFKVDLKYESDQPKIEFINNQMFIEFKLKFEFNSEYMKSKNSVKYFISINETYKLYRLKNALTINSKYGSIEEAMQYIEARCDKIFG